MEGRETPMKPYEYTFEKFTKPVTLRSLSLTSVLLHSGNRRVSGFRLHLRPNPLYARTSDTRKTLFEINFITKSKKYEKISIT